MELLDLINENLIVTELEASNKEETIKKLIDMLEKEERLISREKFFEDVLFREQLCSTYVGQGVAIPHGKTDAVKKTSVAIGKLANPIEWDEKENNYVNIVFLLAVQDKDADNQHLRILANIATKLMEKDFIDNLTSISDKDGILALFREDTIEL